MAEELKITATKKEGKYMELLPQIKGLVAGEDDLFANLANVCSALKYSMNFLWVGFYFVRGNDLVLGPFQGPIACTRIAKGKGVCGTSWVKKEPIVVPDVDRFEGHISCSALSKSEVVIPIFDSQKNVIAVLDIDSDKLNDFGDADVKYLTEILTYVKFSSSRV
jgi:L-methionine (R)-S-oxide reductase